MAALAVVLYHYVGFIPLMRIPVGPIGSVVVTLTRYGYLGVQIFFVLSGYVIAMTASRYSFTPTAGAIRPPPAGPARPALLGYGRSNGGDHNCRANRRVLQEHDRHFRSNPGPFGIRENLLGFPSLNVAFWTLCLEVQFYLVFVASVVAVRRCSPAVRSVWFAALTLGSVLINFLNAIPQDWFPRLWYQFGLGVLVYYGGQERSARLALPLLLPILVGLGLYRSQAADITVTLVAGLLLSSSRLSKGATACPGILMNLGRISYSLYLVHGFVGIGVSVVFLRSASQSATAAWIAIAAGIAGSVTFATAFYVLCERRGVEWSRLVCVVPAGVSALGLAAEPAPTGSWRGQAQHGSGWSQRASFGVDGTGPDHDGVHSAHNVCTHPKLPQARPPCRVPDRLSPANDPAG